MPSQVPAFPRHPRTSRPRVRFSWHAGLAAAVAILVTGLAGDALGRPPPGADPNSPECGAGAARPARRNAGAAEDVADGRPVEARPDRASPLGWAVPARRQMDADPQPTRGRRNARRHEDGLSLTPTTATIRCTPPDMLWCVDLPRPHPLLPVRPAAERRSAPATLRHPIPSGRRMHTRIKRLLGRQQQQAANLPEATHATEPPPGGMAGSRGGLIVAMVRSSRGTPLAFCRSPPAHLRVRR